MAALFGLVAYDRESLIIAALAGLTVAGVIMALGALLLLLKGGGSGRRGPAPSDSPGSTQAPASEEATGSP